MAPRYFRPKLPNTHLGVTATALWGGGVVIHAKPNRMVALIEAFAKETGRRLEPDVIPWTPRMLPRFRWQLLRNEAEDLMRWLVAQPPTWATRRLFIVIRNAMLAGRGLTGCEPC